MSDVSETSYPIPGRPPLEYREVDGADTYAIRQIFDSIFRDSIERTGDQLPGDDGARGPFVVRPSQVIQMASNRSRANAYLESLDIWDGLLGQDGRLTAAGLRTANCILDPTSEYPSLEAYIGQRHSFSDAQALTITSRALWDLLLIRGLPTYHEPTNPA